jgi:hypothetical protein
MGAGPSACKYPQSKIGSLGIPVVSSCILGYERAYARSYPKMQPSSRNFLESRKIVYTNR